MTKRTKVFLGVAAVIAFSTGYDFFRGYHETGSVGGGIAYIVFGLIVAGALALLYWLSASGKSSK
jgi:hypothetical protein